ncbi:hypothetical protein DDZ16_08375 [Marinilabilia rubra]|uniref:Uncharacterized protein n=1 Tax=Marinilabilia rubra TaxID=2162893 RepID=A0A2U2B9Z8_9BACT|nr:hypothetical protein DDZ16_08375 [Marinilabilia rubra]
MFMILHTLISNHDFRLAPILQQKKKKQKMPSLKESRNKFLLLLPFGAKAYKTIIGKKSEYFPEIRKLSRFKFCKDFGTQKPTKTNLGINQSGFISLTCLFSKIFDELASSFLNGKHSDFLNEIVLMRNVSPSVCQSYRKTYYSVD